MAGESATRWSGQDLWIQRGISNFMERGQDTDKSVSATEILTSDYYRHFLNPADVRHAIGIKVRDGVSSLATQPLNGGESAGPFTPSELALIEALRPHLIIAYAISKRIASLQDEAASLRASFDRLPLGMLVLESDGRIAEQNEEATRLLLARRGIAYAAGGGLRLTDPASQAKYRAALARLSNENRSPAPESIVARGPARLDTGTLVLHLCAFPAPTAPVLVRQDRIVAFLSELSRYSTRQFATQLLRATLDLTPMEAAVVLSLRDKHDPMHVALELGLAISTVRSHLKHAFRKTGTSRQSELLRMVDRLISAAPV